MRKSAADGAAAAASAGPRRGRRGDSGCQRGHRLEPSSRQQLDGGAPSLCLCMTAPLQRVRPVLRLTFNSVVIYATQAD